MHIREILLAGLDKPIFHGFIISICNVSLREVVMCCTALTLVIPKCIGRDEASLAVCALVETRLRMG